jgi:aminopeptidase-like protein
MSLERQYHAWTCKVGYKERQYIDPCVQCINTNINVYPSYCCSKYMLFYPQTEKLTETLKVMLQAENVSCVLMNLAEMCNINYN